MSKLTTAAVVAGLLLATSGQAQFGKNKVRYEHFDWHIYHSPHFNAYYYPKMEGNLEKVVSLAESAYDRLSQELDYQIQEPTPLILFATHSEFLQNNVILNFIPEGVGAFATDTRFRMVLPIDLPEAELYKLMLHELTHIFQYHLLFGASLGKSLTLNAPTWLTEGMASYFAQDESTNDRMYLRDAVVNDSIPPITGSNVSGFFAYRFGHAAFDFMEERWGRDGVLDFLYELRNTLGGRVGKAIERAFRIDPDDFDVEFRRWLRRKYLPQLVETGEPSDFGRPFRTPSDGSQESSAVASPSGDLVASFSTYKNDLDVVLFDTETRRPLRNLTKGLDTSFRSFAGQMLTVGRRDGRDIAFSPDGNQLAVFVRKEEGYSLALINVLKGGIDLVIDMPIQQQTAPAWSPDGRTIAFSGNLAGQFDIFLLDLETREIRNLTNDDIFDGGPTFSPDGNSLVFVSVPEETSQLFEVTIDDPKTRVRLTDDEFTNTDPVFSSDGKTLYFTSDRTGAENIYGLELESRKLSQYTNTVTGCFMPTVLSKVSQPDTLVYTGFWKGRLQLYENEVTEPINVTQLEAPTETGVGEIARFVPDIQVTIDESKKEDKKGFRLFLEDAQTVIGVDNDQTFLGQVVLTFSDFLGDRRLIGVFSSVDSFSNFNVTYADLSHRWQWSASAFDDRAFFRAGFIDPFTGNFGRGRQAFRQTGVIGTLTYPFSFKRRVELSTGFISRKINFGSLAYNSNGFPVLDDQGDPIQAFPPSDDQYPLVGVALVSDSTIYGPAGPTAGHRVRLSTTWAPDLSESGTLTSTVQLDARKYFPLTRRSLFAVRLFGSVRDGRLPDPLYFGGFDTVRGFNYRDFLGDRGFYTNFEFRFPLIDYFITPVLSFRGIQGRIFLDVAGAWFKDAQSFQFFDSETNTLGDAVAAYGLGLTVNFLGVDLHFDWAKRWDLKQSGDTFMTFWIGQRF